MKFNILRFINKANESANLYLKNQKNDRKKLKKTYNLVENRTSEINNFSKDTNLKIKSLEAEVQYLKGKVNTIEILEKWSFEKNQIIEGLLLNNLDVSDKFYCPICKNYSWAFLPFGENPRKNAMCPKCGSVERHRLVYLFFKYKKELFNKDIKLLHFAPETIFHNIFSKCDNIDYWPVDLFMEHNVREKVDIQNIPYEDNTFDIIYNSHVLEHVPDDIKAMKELYRVVKPFSDGKGGSVITMAPIFHDLPVTLEKEEYNTPELRSLHYGQFDHVRKYGADFKDRLESVGFKVEVFDVKILADQEKIPIPESHVCGGDKIYFCTK